MIGAASEGKLIVCFLPAAKAEGLVAALRREKGIVTADLSMGRGTGAVRRVTLGAWDEVGIVTVPVTADRADEIFAFMFEAGELDRPKGGLIIQQALVARTDFRLPDLPYEED